MRRSSTRWFVPTFGLVCLGLLWLWQAKEVRTGSPRSAAVLRAKAPAKFVYPNLLAASSAPGSRPSFTNALDRLHPFRLRNTSRPLAELVRDDHVIHLANALIDSTHKEGVSIPPAWQSAADPKAYIIQSTRQLDDAFRSRIAAAGGQIISYIPNNAYLVRIDGPGAAVLSAADGVQAILPYEPYYKVDEQLLKLASSGQSPPPDFTVKLVLFPNGADQAEARITQTGAEVLGHDTTPFGPALVVKPSADGWMDLAKMDSVQLVERYVHRRPANDLVRVALGVAPNSQIGTTNYLGLTGNKVVVSLNDTGVDAQHPDFAPDRVFTISGGDTNLVDFAGHGTHVAGTIAGNGSQSSTVNSASVPGSSTNADYRGIAPAASIFILPIDLQNGPFISNEYLQTNAAAVKARLSNNSWTFPGVNEYNSDAASYDAAVRDALPTVPGMQPILYVFAAGNDGNGAQDGTGGDPGSITSPGTAKNVITVGASENFRNITNSVITTDTNTTPSTFTTNQVYLGWTQDPAQIAFFSSRGNVGIGTEGDFGRFKPDVVAPGTFVASVRSRQWQFTNDYSPLSPTYPVDLLLDQVLGSFYRFDSGTSMAAPAVTGVLALFQEFFEQRLHQTNSPALFKALLINGARTLGPLYDFQVQTGLNEQGWGLINLTNSLPAALTNGPSSSPVQYFDQSPDRALSTGQSLTWVVTLGTNSASAAANSDLKMTLVWTDPPGNPVVGIKLVNDLDLIVTNLATGEVFLGNNFPQSSITTQSVTNDPVLGPNALADIVNNVENVFLSPVTGPLGSTYSITVFAHRVNVNAVTAHPNGVVQDFALVVASASPAAQISLGASLPAVNPAPWVVSVTNGIPLLDQRVGADSPLIGGTNGTTNQWRYYVFNNTVTNGTNVAFATFFPPNLGVPRNQSADIDMYVSTDPNLINLNPGAVAGSFKSLNRNGTQAVIFTNEPAGRTYYVGIKAEDQQAAQFGFFAVASAQPFSNQDPNGNTIITGLPVPQPIPDGNLTRPGRALIFGFSTSTEVIRRVTVTNNIYHELVGDLVDILTLNGSEPTFLLNHNLSLPTTDFPYSQFIFDDVQTWDVPGAVHTDGPGSLRSYIGQQGAGLWLLDVEDTIPVHTGIVQNVWIKVEPKLQTNNLTAIIPPGQFSFDFVDVPANATNLTIQVQSGQGPVEVFLLPGDLPGLTNFTKMATINGNGSLSLGLNDSPPLTPGLWFIGFYNPNPFTITVQYQIILGLALTGAGQNTFHLSNQTPLLDDAHTVSTLTVTNASDIFTVNVAVRIDAPRVSDLVLRLTGPSGKTVLLTENRGGTTGTAYGGGAGPYLYTLFTEDTNLTTAPIKFGLAPFTNGSVRIGFETNGPPIFTNSFENAKPGQKYTVGTVLDGWTVVSKTVSIFDNNLGFVGPSDTGSNCLNINGTQPGSVTTSFTTVIGQVYAINFAFVHSPQGQSSLARLSLSGQKFGDLTNVDLFSSVPNSIYSLNWEHISYTFTANSTTTTIQLTGLNPGPNGMFFDSFIIFKALAVIGAPYLPEEPLSAFQGDTAYGLWTLDLLDDRVGPSDIPAQLLDWQLLFTFTPTNFPAIPLRDTISVTNSVVGSNMVFFVVDVPAAATAATNTLVSLTSGPLNLWFSQTGLPDSSINPFGSQTGDDEILIGVTNIGVRTLTTNLGSLPPLVPGQEYYLGVANDGPGLSNNFVLTVSFDRQFYEPGLTKLFNGVPVTTNIAASNVMYFVYDITTNAGAAQFQIFNQMGGSLELFVDAGAEGKLPGPGVGGSDFASENPGVALMPIIITPASQPPLIPGLEYLAVFNPGATPVTYTIEARELAAPPSSIITLTNGVPYHGYAFGFNTVEFVVYAPPAALSATNILSVLGGGDDLWYNQTAPPTAGQSPNDWNLFSTTSSNYFVMDTDTSTPVFIPGQPYYLGVQNFDLLSSGEFTIQVNFDKLGLPSGVPILKNGVTLFTNIPPGAGLQFFEYDTLDGLGAGPPPYSALFQVFPTAGGAGSNLVLYISPYPPPLPVPGDSAYTGTNSGITNLIYLSGASNPPVAASGPVPLTSSQFWYVGVLNTGDTNLSYGIRVDEKDTPPPWPFVIDSEIVETNGFLSITWNSYLGQVYYVQGRANLSDPVWYDIAPPFFATNFISTYQIPATIPLQYFRVSETNEPWQPNTNNNIFLNLQMTVLSNAVWSTNSIQGGVSNSFAGSPTQFYEFDVAPNATNVTFILDNLQTAGQISFVVKKGVLPALNYWDYYVIYTPPPPPQLPPPFLDTLSLNAHSLPVPLSPGPWFLGVFYQVPNTVSYRIQASEDLFATNSVPTNPPPQFVVLPNATSFTTNGFALSWSSIPGDAYFVQGKVNLTDPAWQNLSPKIIAATATANFLVPANSTFRFFRIEEIP